MTDNISDEDWNAEAHDGLNTLPSKAVMNLKDIHRKTAEVMSKASERDPEYVLALLVRDVCNSSLHMRRHDVDIEWFKTLIGEVVIEDLMNFGVDEHDTPGE